MYLHVGASFVGELAMEYRDPVMNGEEMWRQLLLIVDIYSALNAIFSHNIIFVPSTHLNMPSVVLVGIAAIH